jgi:hypothetical protein
MRTIVAFRSRDDDRALLLALGHTMNAAWPGVFDEEDFKPRCRSFTCYVADSGDWQEHLQGTLDVLEKCGEIFARAARVGIRVRFDIAIWPEDRAAQGRVRLTFPPPLMAALGAAGAWFLVSDYVGLDDGDQAYIDELYRDDDVRLG